MTILNIAIAGAGGRMGRMLVEAVLNADDLRLSGALGIAGSDGLGQDAGAFLGKVSGAIVTCPPSPAIACGIPSTMTSADTPSPLPGAINTRGASAIAGGAPGYEAQGYTLVRFFFLCTFAAAVPAIISGGIAERAKFAPQAMATAALVGLFYPLLEGVYWNGNFGLQESFFKDVLGAPFKDFAGSNIDFREQRRDKYLSIGRSL